MAFGETRFHENDKAPDLVGYHEFKRQDSTTDHGGVGFTSLKKSITQLEPTCLWVWRGLRIFGLNSKSIKNVIIRQSLTHKNMLLGTFIATLGRSISFFVRICAKFEIS